MIGWFGESWGAPVCDPELHVETPVGWQCIGHDHLHVDRSPLIEEGDQGVTLPLYVEPGRADRAAYHLDCWLHEVGADRLP